MKAWLLLAAALLLPCLALAAGESPRLVGPSPMPAEVPAPPLPADRADDVRRTRNYPDQPPVIPHSIADYQIDLNTNRCLTCHARQYAEAVQAPMISVTHYQDRDGQFLGGVSARRYFCTQCHVPQTDARPLVDNRFEDIDTILERLRRGRDGQ